MSRDTIPAPLLLTPEETSAILGRTLHELRQWRAENGVPTFHRLGGRLIRYSRTAVTSSHRLQQPTPLSVDRPRGRRFRDQLNDHVAQLLGPHATGLHLGHKLLTNELVGKSRRSEVVCRSLLGDLPRLSEELSGRRWRPVVRLHIRRLQRHIGIPIEVGCQIPEKSVLK